MRYLPHTPDDIREMLQAIGVSEVEDLFSSIPSALRLKQPLNLPPSLSEGELKRHMSELSHQNLRDGACFLGGGLYPHEIPSVVPQILSRGEFLTAYTPYQPEVSQGTLQAIFEYQTMAAEILGMEIANASHYDGSTATAEAALMALSLTDRKKVLVARSLHPEYREVLRTYLQDGETLLEEVPYAADGSLDRIGLREKLGSDVACVIAATPNFFGVVEDLTDIASMVHQEGGLFVTSTSEPVSLGLFKPPGEMGADIAVAEGQPLGLPVSFGGPSLGLFATKKEFVRSLPGRLVGETVDQEGRRGYVLTLATREQHIRRERATSNICTNVSLSALAATITLALWGKVGFQALAQKNFDLASELKERLSSLPGVSLRFAGTTFNEFVVTLPKDPVSLTRALLKEKIFAGIPLTHWYPELPKELLVCVTETTTERDQERLVEGLRRIL